MQKHIPLSALSLLLLSACATTVQHGENSEKRDLSSKKFIYKCEPDTNSWAVTQKLELDGFSASVTFKADPWHKGEEFSAERDDQYAYEPEPQERKDKVVFTLKKGSDGKAIIVDADMLEGARRGDLKIRHFQTTRLADRDGTKNVTYSCLLK